jgi:hypothetical protein
LSVIYQRNIRPENPMNKLVTATDPILSATLADNLAAYAEQAEGAFEANTKRAMQSDQRLFAA